jgi:hypothetical protein
MAGPPVPVTLKQQRDHALCVKFHPHVARLCSAFSAQNQDAAHPIMVTLVHFAAVTAKACGMRTEGEFAEFCRLVFHDIKEQGQ